ncbi:transcription factor S [Halorhabdus sp. CBA1104]|uniref:RPA12/RPB9/RPC11 RNA polymerase family protein n=1 Tax=unclassified Halorhabdus TaxID=2621901 RepID=UPI0012B340E4|nr:MULTISPECIES: RPA12/RPB9/RPC11 RNA polymerase family protein [unclassified Halorhabdus]QGN06067.1 transcription factor S [Halorhabdus sp. CBA1104]
MQFCDECGSMMHAVERSSTSNQHSSSSDDADGDEMVCQSCGYREAKDQELAEDFVSTEDQSDDDLIETEEDANFEGKPTADDVHCDECGHGHAWYTIKQTGSADEPPTRFFKCKECGHRWRGYS